MLDFILVLYTVYYKNVVFLIKLAVFLASGAACMKLQVVE